MSIDNAWWIHEDRYEDYGDDEAEDQANRNLADEENARAEEEEAYMVRMLDKQYDPEEA